MRLFTLIAALLSTATITLAQMGPGPSTTPTTSASAFTQMFQAMAGVTAMGSGMGIGMTGDLVVGPDGPAYIGRPIAVTGQAAAAGWQYELIAINPSDGKPKWKLSIPGGGRISIPVLAPDGNIYLTVDNYQMFYANLMGGGSMMTQSQAQANDGQLLIISQRASSATVAATVQTTSDVLSAPAIVADPSGGYLIYVVGYDMMSWSSMFGSASTAFGPGEKKLYVLAPDGSLKYSLLLSQAPAGMN